MCDEAPRKPAIERLSERETEAARMFARQQWRRPVPPEMLTDDEAWARRTMTPICRALRVDPDGPHEPMLPAFWWNAEECMRKDAEREREIGRDAALVRALRFT